MPEPLHSTPLSKRRIDPQGSPSRADFAQFVRDESARWAKLVKEANIKVE